ncbi:MAG TPA: hypothetical protein VFK50_07180 [Sphingomicrobium sp.]|nr:hypothetical protein [Sphingomicrobium sp.]
MVTERYSSGAPRPWWETRPFVALLILLSIVPLLYPPIPPLVDLFGHMGRYRVQLELDTSPHLSRFYDYEWAPIGNLGVDLLIWPMASLFGLELATKLIVMAIPPMTVAGFLWVAREVHHRLPPTVLFALPIAYSHPFQFGFVNYALAMAFAFLAFGLWLRLGRLGKVRLRAALFVPISFVVFFTHTFGWGMLGLMCFSAEAVRQHDRGTGWFRSAWWAALHALVMVLPALVILDWRSSVQGSTATGFFNWKLKGEALITVLRDRWILFDWASLALITLLVIYAIFSRRLTLSRNLAFSALVLAVVFVLLPRMVFSSAYADMRLIPFVFAIAVLAIRFRSETYLPLARRLAVVGLAFYLLRIGAHTVSYIMTSDEQQAKLEALDYVPMGSVVLSFVGRPCGDPWPLERNSHLSAMTIVRRHGFSNDQWITEGVNLLQLRSRFLGPFSADPSEIVRPTGCRRRPWWISRALKTMPRDKIDYLWLITPPPYDPELVAGMKPVWRGPDSILYQANP